jgi:hypothetical protein
MQAEQTSARIYPTLLSRQQASSCIKTVASCKGQLEETVKGEIATSEGPRMSPRVSELCRSVQRLLNKVCPENLDALVPQFSCIPANNSSELGFVIGLILQRARLDPHYIETYADLMLRLDGSWQDKTPTTFRQLLLKSCREAYEALPSSFEAAAAEERAANAPENLEFPMKKTKDNILAFMRLLGNLFLRDLIPTRVIGFVMNDLVDHRPDGLLPFDHHVECACVLVASVGASLNGDPHGRVVLPQILTRLQELRNAKTEDGSECYSKRLQFTMQDTLDLRDAAWVKKSFSEKAVKKNELRCQSKQASLLIVAGERPRRYTEPDPLILARERPQPRRNTAPPSAQPQNDEIHCRPKPSPLTVVCDAPLQSRRNTKLDAASPQLASPRSRRTSPKAAQGNELRSRPEEASFCIGVGERPQSRRNTASWSPAHTSGSGQQLEEKASSKLNIQDAPSEPLFTKKITVTLPEGFLHTLIGHNGATVRTMQMETGARIFVHKDANTARLTGGAEAVAAAKNKIDELIQSMVSKSPAGTFASQPCKWFMMGRCGKGDACTYLHSGPAVAGPKYGARTGGRPRRADTCE